MRRSARITLLVLIALLVCLLLNAAGDEGSQPPPVNDGSGGSRELRAPPVRKGFSFVIFGDRTGGEASGLRILDQAVAATNRLDPDFVMTVGDLVQGYTGGDAWLAQTRRHQRHMNRLRMPWYPVAGNHDVRGAGGRAVANVDRYREHVGPLYYSFDYRWAHLVCLFTDEAVRAPSSPKKAPSLGKKQLSWLCTDLKGTKAEQVYLFLHHPHWKAEGRDWKKVHDVLVNDGRVRAVFAGHRHEYRDDGIRDGIHYYVLGVTGGHQGSFPETTNMQHIVHVRARPAGLTSIVLPVGSVVGSGAILGPEVDKLKLIQSGDWLRVWGTVDIDFEKARTTDFQVILENPDFRKLGYEVQFTVPPGWKSSPETRAGTLDPGGKVQEKSRVEIPAFMGTLPAVYVEGTLHFPLSSGMVQPVVKRVRMPVRLTGVPRSRSGPHAVNRVLELDGKSAVRVPLELMEGPFTLECWARGSPPRGRQGLVTRTEGCSFGIFWCDNGPPFPSGVVMMKNRPGGRDAGYAATSAKKKRDWTRWVHLALTWDGRHARFFVDGKCYDEVLAKGDRIDSRRPLYIGADLGANNEPECFFRGAIDEVRLSSVARYKGRFRPAGVLEPDEQTVFLFHFDRDGGHSLFADDSGHSRHGWGVGRPRIVEEQVRTAK